MAVKVSWARGRCTWPGKCASKPCARRRWRRAGRGAGRALMRMVPRRRARLACRWSRGGAGWHGAAFARHHRTHGDGLRTRPGPRRPQGLGERHPARRRTRAAWSRQRLRGWLVAGEVAAATLILSGAALLGAATWRCRTSSGLQPPAGAHGAGVADGRGCAGIRVAFTGDVLARLGALPGVSAAAGTSFLPLDGNPGIGSSFLLANRPEPPAGERPVADYRPVTPGYFGTLQIPLHARTRLHRRRHRRAGRAWRSSTRRSFACSRPTSRRSAAADRFAGRDPGNRRRRRRCHAGQPHGEFRPAIYLPFAQQPIGAITFVVRTAGGEPEALGPAWPASCARSIRTSRSRTSGRSTRWWRAR